MQKISRQSYICYTAAIGGLLFGFDTAVISGALQPVKVQFGLNTIMEGWLVSSGLLGCILGVAFTGITADRIGRRKSIVIAAVMFLLSAITCTAGFSVSMLIAGRIIGGIGVGMASVLSPMYITEFAPAARRGQMVSYYQLAITIGILLAYFSNALLDTPAAQHLFQTEVWRPMFLVMALPSLLFLLLLARVPESPRWLMRIREKQQAATILQQVMPAEEAAQAYRSIEEAAQRSAGLSRSLLSPGIRLPLIIGIVLAVFQQFSGINAIIYYGPSIFEKAGIDSKNALLFQVIIGAVNVLATLIAVRWVDSYGRKRLMQIGLSGIVFTLILCGALFYTGHTQGPWLLVLMLLFIACFAFSLGPITWVIINEIFPTDVRARAVAVCTLMLWIAVALVGQFVPWLLSKAGAAAMFWLFAGCSLFNLLFSSAMVKETSGKTLEEMEDMYVAPSSLN